MGKVVCFAGHRLDIYNVGIQERLESVLENLINQGYTSFLNGDKGDFDRICFDMVLKLKKKYPHIKIYKVLTYYKPDKIYENISSDYEEVFPEIEDYYPKIQIIKRNEWIVRQSDVVVCNIKNTFKSGAYRMVCYAKKLNKNIINI